MLAPGARADRQRHVGRAHPRRAGLAAYTAAKGAIEALTKTLALELAPHGITVNAVAPGAIDTPMNANAYTAEVRRTYEERIPMRRIGTAEEVADVVLFLASDARALRDGQELVVDGGLTIAPGATAFTVIAGGASSSASTFVSATIAPLAAV